MQIAPSVILIVELYIVIMFSHHGDLDQTLGEGRGSKFMEEAVSTGPAGLGLTSHASIIQRLKSKCVPTHNYIIDGDT